jgi:hypothetical protein
MSAKQLVDAAVISARVGGQVPDALDIERDSRGGKRFYLALS